MCRGGWGFNARVMSPRPSSIALAVWVSGCAASPAPEPVAPEPAQTSAEVAAAPEPVREEPFILQDERAKELRKQRTPIQAVKRPEEIAAFPFDHSTIPAIPFAESTTDDRGSFTLENRPNNGYSLKIVDDLIADIDLGSFRGFTLGAKGSYKHVPTTVFNPDTPPCGVATHTKNYSWDALKQAEWSDEGVDYFVFDGKFDFAACSSTVDYVTRVRAQALVPKLVYAYRRCNGDQNRCDDPERTWEQVTFIAPPSSWIASSVAPEMQTRPRVGAFSHVTLPLLRGSSASVLFTVSVPDMAFFFGLHGAAPRWMSADENANVSLQLSIEIVWPEEDSAPSGRASISAPTSRGAEVLASLFRRDALRR